MRAIPKGSRVFSRYAHGSTPRDASAQVVRGWRIERDFARIRWLAVTCWLLLTPVLPTASTLAMASLALAYGCGNLALWRLLRGTPCPGRLRSIRRLAAAVEWLAVLGVLALATDDFALISPAMLLLMLPIAAARYALPGVATVTVVAGLLAIASLAIRAWTLDLLGGHAAMISAIIWVVLIGISSLLLSLILLEERDERARWETERAGYQRERHSLSRREWVVLGLLLQGASYHQVAEQLNIEYETVRSHVRYLGAKLGVDGGRAAIIRRASELDLLPLIDDETTERGSARRRPAQSRVRVTPCPHPRSPQ